MGRHEATLTNDIDKLKEAVRLLQNCDRKAALAVASTMSKQGKQKFIQQMRGFNAKGKM